MIKPVDVRQFKIFRWPTYCEAKKCFSDREKLLKFEGDSREFAKILRSLEQFIQTVKGLNNFWWQKTVKKNCSRDREKLLKFEADGWEFAKFLRSLEQFIQTVKGQNNFC